MPRTLSDYPDAFKNLPAKARHQAIKIANALLKKWHEEGMAIAIAITNVQKTKQKISFTKISSKS